MGSVNRARVRFAGTLVCLTWVFPGVLPGCAAERGGSVRPVEELPAAYAELWRAWLADEPDWPGRREQAREQPELLAFLIDNLIRQMVRGYDRSEVTVRRSEALTPFDRARGELIVLGDASGPVLAELMGVADAVVGGLAAGLLKDIGRPAVLPTAGQLDAERDVARMRAAELLAELPYAPGPGDEDLVRAALVERLADDPSWLVRAKAAEALGRRGASDRETATARRALCGALADPEPTVVVRASQALVVLEDPEAIPALINLLERKARASDVGGLRAAQAALQALSGQREDRDVSEWRAWWVEHRPPPRPVGD